MFLKFVAYLRSKMNAGLYDFFAKVFNIPTSWTLSNYDTLDGQSKDGILYETIHQMEMEFQNRLDSLNPISVKHAGWLRCGILKFDEMKIKEKI